MFFSENLLLQNLGHHHQPPIMLDMVQNPLSGYTKLLPLQLLFVLDEHLSQLVMGLLGFFEMLQLFCRQLGTRCLSYHQCSWVSVSSCLSWRVDLLVFCPVRSVPAECIGNNICLALLVPELGVDGLQQPKTYPSRLCP